MNKNLGSFTEDDMKAKARSKYLKSNLDKGFNLTTTGMSELVKQTNKIYPIIEQYVSGDFTKKRSAWARNLRESDIKLVVATTLNVIFSEITLDRGSKAITAQISRKVGKIFYSHVDDDISQMQSAAGLIGSVINHCDIIYKDIKSRGKKTVVSYHFYDDYLTNIFDGILEHSNELIYPMPMTEKPIDWGYVRIPDDGAKRCEKGWILKGGYKTFKSELIRRETGTNLRRFGKNVFKALNIIQSVAFRVNKPVFEKVKEELGECPKKGDFIDVDYYNNATEEYNKGKSRYTDFLHWKITEGLKSVEIRKAAKMDLEEAKDIFAEKKAIYREAKSKWMTAKGKWTTNKIAVEIAEKYKDEPRIYFPHNFDYRGRIYPIPISLNPQGNDAVKAMLEFADPQEISDEGVYHLTAFLASLFGHDKLPLEDRFVLGNELVYADWHEADEPYQAYKVQLFLQDFLENDNRDCRCHIALDGTVNGFQNLSALSLDASGGKSVNVIGTERNDLYIDVANHVISKLEDGSVWLDYVNRACVKKICMTCPYGLSKYAAKDYVIEYLVSVNAPRELYRKAGTLSNLIYDSVYEVMGGAKDFMEWSQSAAVKIAKEKRVNRHSGVARWRTPDGFIVNNAKFETTQTNVSFKTSGRSGVMESWIKLRKRSNRVSVAKSKSSISPNIIHSLDATHLRMTSIAANEEGITDTVFIHDDFGTRPNDIVRFGEIIREQFLDMYSSDIRETLANDLKTSPVPVKNTMKLEDVLLQPYFFS